MALTMDKIFNILSTDQSETKMISRDMLKVLEQVDSQEGIPNSWKVKMLIGAYAKKPDQYHNLVRLLPEEKSELEKIRFGGENWNWKPDQVASIMGYSNVNAMLDPKKGWKTKLIKDNPDFSENASLEWIEEDEGLPNGSLRKWLDNAQAQYDRNKKYGSLPYQAYSMISPRQVEAWKAGKEATWKDVGLDMAEDLLMFYPWARPATKGASLGLRALGLTQKPAAKKLAYGAAGLGGAAFAPTVTTVADASLYDENENPDRANRDWRDAATGTIVNLATAPNIASEVAGKVRQLGGESGRRGVIDVLTSDPYVDAIKKADEIYKVAPSKTQFTTHRAKIENDILKDLAEAEKMAVKEGLGSADRMAWWKDLHTPKSDPQQEALRQTVLKEYQNTILEFKRIYGNDKKAFKEAVMAYVDNSKIVNPSRAMEAYGKGTTYAFGHGGRAGLATFNPKYKPPSAESNMDIVFPAKDNSISALRNAEMNSHPGNPNYPNRPGLADKYLENLKQKANINADASVRNMIIPSFSVGAKTFGVNKVGKDEMAQRLTGDSFTKTESEQEIINILNDPAVIAMWRDLKFKPRENPDDPYYKAWLIWKKYNKE